ncbi:S-phase kinase-associated 2 isoform X2, partial [Paramuricea clavata]
MADNTKSTNHSNNKNVKSLANSSTVLISDNVISLNVEDQYDLRWPTSQERDFTQIITEDTATKSNINNCDADGRQEKELKQCPEMKKMQQKKSCNSEENKICCNNHSNKSSSFLGHKPKMKHRKLTSLESVAPADSNGLQKINHWNVFSDEIILGIFSFLAKKNLCVCAKVCKKWRSLACDKSLWQSLDLTGLTLREDVLQHLFMRGVVVMRLAWLEVLSLQKSEKYSENSTE